MNDFSALPQKQCSNPDCLQWFPATPEFFHKNGKQGLLHPYCKQCRNARSRHHHQEHRKEESARKSLYYQKNTEAINTRVRYYQKTHREQVRAWGRVNEQKRLARKRNVTGTLTDQQIQTKLKAQKYACHYCFRPFAKRKDGTFIYQLDHTIPISRAECAPRHDINYVVLACPHCNQSKGKKLPHEFYEGGRLL